MAGEFARKGAHRSRELSTLVGPPGGKIERARRDDLVLAPRKFFDQSHRARWRRIRSRCGQENPARNGADGRGCDGEPARETSVNACSGGRAQPYGKDDHLAASRKGDWAN